ncbi:YnbE family lipoprotein [Allosphingosinicella vermicomposti]|uniref:YnbE family lipoprotein n=1 Tax=Allosphingosinicella vermicomposti TaxID=614671 RepID=UPI000D0FE435|nr:YnbE family lipoprotein [Allosphingosinicella vermicomposti]
MTRDRLERGVAALALPAVLSGCVQLSAPEKPIEINLNINIRQEVVVRLQEDVNKLVEDNPGIF